MPIPLFQRLLLCTALLLAVPSYAEDDGDSPLFAVHLDPERQRLAGIRTQALPRPESRPAHLGLAQTLDPTPLLEASTEYQRLLQAWRNARETAHIAEQRYRRLKRLSDSIQRREREQAHIDWLAAQSRLQTLAIQQEALKQRLLTQWGPRLTQWATQQPQRLEALAAGRLTLLRLVPDRPGSAWVIYQQRRIPIEYFSPAPQADSRLGEAAAFFLAHTPLPSGLRLNAWLGETAEAIPVPATAVIWYGGQPWVYVQIDAETFQRRHLENWRGSGDIWWVTAGVAAGEKVAVRGAQLLLAEEFRSQVPEEDDD